MGSKYHVVTGGDAHRDATIEAFNEVMRARELHPGTFHNVHEGFAVLNEEVDELWEKVKLNPKKIDVGGVVPFGLDPKEMGDRKRERQREKHRQMLREEAIQVAAMAIRFAAELT